MDEWCAKLGDHMRGFGTQIVFECGNYRLMDADDRTLMLEISALEQFAREHGTVTTMPTIPATTDREKGRTTALGNDGHPS
jgi:hypothetical protein